MLCKVCIIYKSTIQKEYPKQTYYFESLKLLFYYFYAKDFYRSHLIILDHNLSPDAQINFLFFPLNHLLQNHQQTQQQKKYSLFQGHNNLRILKQYVRYIEGLKDISANIPYTIIFIVFLAKILLIQLQCEYSLNYITEYIKQFTQYPIFSVFFVILRRLGTVDAIKLIISKTSLQYFKQLRYYYLQILLIIELDFITCSLKFFFYIILYDYVRLFSDDLYQGFRAFEFVQVAKLEKIYLSFMTRFNMSIQSWIAQVLFSTGANELSLFLRMILFFWLHIIYIINDVQKKKTGKKCRILSTANNKAIFVEQLEVMLKELFFI